MIKWTWFFFKLPLIVDAGFLFLRLTCHDCNSILTKRFEEIFKCRYFYITGFFGDWFVLMPLFCKTCLAFLSLFFTIVFNNIEDLLICLCYIIFMSKSKTDICLWVSVQSFSQVKNKWFMWNLLARLRNGSVCRV